MPAPGRRGNRLGVAIEEREQPIRLAGSEPYSAVQDPDFDHIACLDDRGLDRLARGAAVLESVGEQVADDLLDVGRLGLNGSELVGDVQDDLGVGPGLPFALDHVADEPMHQDRLARRVQSAPLGARQDEQVGDDPIESGGVGIDVGDEAADPRAPTNAVGASQQIDPDHDRRDRRPKLVREHAQECVALQVRIDGCGDVAEDHDVGTGRVVGYREVRDLEPAARADRRSDQEPPSILAVLRRVRWSARQVGQSGRRHGRAAGRPRCSRA